MSSVESLFGLSGLTAVVTAAWFGAALFFAPLLSAVPPSEGIIIT